MRFIGIISAFILLFFFVFTLKYFLSIKEPNQTNFKSKFEDNENIIIDHLETIETNLDFIKTNIYK